MFTIPFLRSLPGLALSLAVAGGAYILSSAEVRLAGRAWLEPLTLAILLGTAIRSLLPAASCCRAGIRFAAKFLLEAAIVLLGFGISAATIAEVGPALLAGIAATVACGIGGSYVIGRALGLRPRMAVLVACGNSICGNSAIAAVAPIIGADGEDIATSIGFTAVLGVAVVLLLPGFAAALHMTGVQSGIFAGLTVYAVPQVVAATAPIGSAAVQIGTLVKLVRVLMLGPVVLALSLLSGVPRKAAGCAGARAHRATSLRHLVPWFIIGFLLAAGLRSAGLVPPAVLAPAAAAGTVLTVISMAALGLGVDVRSVAGAGPRVTAAVLLSLALLAAISLTLIAAVTMPGLEAAEGFQRLRL